MIFLGARFYLVLIDNLVGSLVIKLANLYQMVMEINFIELMLMWNEFLKF
jgi:hypothetical protein